MKYVETVLLENIDNPNACFIFPTDISVSRWVDRLLRLRSGASGGASSAASSTVPMDKFIAWDIFKQNSIRSKVQNKKSIPTALRKIFVSRLVRENAELCSGNLIADNGQKKPPVFNSLIRVQWAGQAAHFTPWLTKLLPQLGSWFSKTTGLPAGSILSRDAELFALKFDADDKDLYTLACRYAQFLNEHGLFEPAWETPPFDETGKECFIFFPESLTDYGEYRELLASSGHVKTISALETVEDTCNCDAFFYTNSRSEITEAALYIRALHENYGIEWDSIVVSIPDAKNYEPYVMREFTNRNIPFVKRSGKPLTEYPAGQFFRSVIECVSRDFAFSTFTGLVLNRNLPWKNSKEIHSLVEFGIKNNCISSWVEENDGKELAINVWEDAFKKPFGGYDSSVRKFFNDFKRRLITLRVAPSFAELRRQYFTFREIFFDMEKCTAETNLILSRCISELMHLIDIEKNFPDISTPDPFQFFIEYLSEINYLAQQPACGVTILPYKTAAPAPFDCHIILGANQNDIVVIFSRLDFLPRSKREKLGITDEDASAAFINLHKYNSLKNTAFFCSEQTFSGYTIPHSKLFYPSYPKVRYAADPGMEKKFNEDYFFLENSSTGKLHEIQKHGFDQWQARCMSWKQMAEENSDEKWNNNILPELISGLYAKNTMYPGKYSVSASSLGLYYQCSLKWLYQNVLAIENLLIEANLMAENISGIVYHSVLNLFLTELKNNNEQILPPDYIDGEPVVPDVYIELLEKSITAVFSGFPALYSGGKSEMSALTARLITAGKNIFYFQLKNFFAIFLSYFAGCRVTGTEISYQAERDKYFLNGKLDCLLKDSRDNYIIIDFKLKRLPSRADCIFETDDDGNNLSNFQLPMYITLAEENEKIEVNTALFFSIIDPRPEVIFGTIENINTNVIIPSQKKIILRNSSESQLIFDEFNRKTKQFADEIITGNFLTEYNECTNCDFNRICRTDYRIKIPVENY